MTPNLPLRRLTSAYRRREVTDRTLRRQAPRALADLLQAERWMRAALDADPSRCALRPVLIHTRYDVDRYLAGLPLKSALPMPMD